MIPAVDTGIVVQNTAKQRVQRLVQRKQERNIWRMEKRHLDAVRDASDLAIEIGTHRRQPAGRTCGGKERRDDAHLEAENRANLNPEQRWLLLNELFRNNDLNKNGTVPNTVFVKILRGLDLFLGEVRHKPLHYHAVRVSPP